LIWRLISMLFHSCYQSSPPHSTYIDASMLLYAITKRLVFLFFPFSGATF
jgi:hypothetical protein